MSANIHDSQRSEQVLSNTLRRLLWVSPLAMAGATVANLTLYAVSGSLFPAVAAWPGAGPGQIVGASIGYLFFATLTLAVIARISSQPARHYQIVAVVGLLLSLVMPISTGLGYGPPGAPPASVATVVTLSLMHIISFAISVPIFIRLALD